MNLKCLSDSDLHAKNLQTANRERAITLKLLKQLNETERRHLCSKFNCSSLHAYCVKELKMSDPQAGRRVAASRLLREVPSIEEKILDGSMSLTSVSQAAVFFKKEAQAGEALKREEKLKVLSQLESKSTRDVERILISHASSTEIHLRDSIKQKTKDKAEVKLHFDQNTIEDLERLKSIWSHAMPNATLSEIVARAVGEMLERVDPVKKAERVTKKKERPQTNEGQLLAKQSNRSSVKHRVYLRDKGQCTFIDPRTNARCESKHFLEEDHIIPRAMGGGYSLENIRLRCRAHNQRHAIDSYGIGKMQAHMRSLRE